MNRRRRSWIALCTIALGVACGTGDDGPSTGSGASGASSTGASTTGSGGAGQGVTSSGAGGTAGGAGTRGGGGGASGQAGTAGSAGSAGTGGGSIDAGPDRRDAETDAPRDPFDAGGDARRDAAGSDADPLYNPCPPTGTPCVIMPLGDSITQGAPNPPGGGYRVPLFQWARMNMKTITFVGSGADGPTTINGVPFPRAHEGHSGFNIDDTQGRMGISQFFPAAINTYKPNIVLLMIGTNDVDTGVTDGPMRLGHLIDTIVDADPKILVVVAKIVPQQKALPDTKNMQIEEYNAAIPALVQSRVNAGKHVALVDMYRTFTLVPNYSTLLLADRLHPTPEGFVLMADTWYAAIGPLLR